MRAGIQAVLFDLDGTLIDSAPDLAAAANDLLVMNGRATLPFEKFRPYAGSGARGMLEVGFGMRPADHGYDAMRDAFYARYEARMLERTRVYDAVLPVLAALDVAGVPWGIVTNKAMRFAGPGVEATGLRCSAAVLVAGDTTPYTKPHPAPLLEAARCLGVLPGACVYVGDDPRDVQAGQAAGMATLAAAWGYLGPAAPVQDWGADWVLDHPHWLLQWLELS